MKNTRATLKNEGLVGRWGNWRGKGGGVGRGWVGGVQGGKKKHNTWKALK